MVARVEPVAKLLEARAIPDSQSHRFCVKEAQSLKELAGRAEVVVIELKNLHCIGIQQSDQDPPSDGCLGSVPAAECITRRAVETATKSGPWLLRGTPVASVFLSCCGDNIASTLLANSLSESHVGRAEHPAHCQRCTFPRPIDCPAKPDIHPGLKYVRNDI